MATSNTGALPQEQQVETPSWIPDTVKTNTREVTNLAELSPLYIELDALMDNTSITDEEREKQTTAKMAEISQKTKTTENDDGTVTLLLSTGNGWCFYNTILQAFGKEQRPEWAQCLAEKLVNALKAKFSKEEDLRAHIVTTVMLSNVEDYTHQPVVNTSLGKKGERYVDTDGSEKNRPYFLKGIDSKIIVNGQRKEGEYYIQKGTATYKAFTELDTDAYLTSLHTPLGDNVANGPETWPDIGIFHPVLRDMFGPYIAYRGDYDKEFTYIDGNASQNPDTPHIVFHGTGGHFNLLKFKPGSPFENITTYPYSNNNIINDCTKEQAPAQQSPQPKLITPNNVQIYNDRFKQLIKNYESGNITGSEIQSALAFVTHLRETPGTAIAQLSVDLPNNFFATSVSKENEEGAIINELNRIDAKYKDKWCDITGEDEKRLLLLKFVMEVRGIQNNGVISTGNEVKSCTIQGNKNTAQITNTPVSTPANFITSAGPVHSFASTTLTEDSDLAAKVTTVTAALEKAQGAHTALTGPADRELADNAKQATGVLEGVKPSVDALGITIPPSPTTPTGPGIMSSLYSGVSKGASSLYSGASSVYSGASSLYSGVKSGLSAAGSTLSGLMNELLSSRRRLETVPVDSEEGKALRAQIAILEKKISDQNAKALKEKVAALEAQGKTSSEEIEKLKEQLKKLEERPASVVTKIEVPTVPVNFSSSVNAKLLSYRPLVSPPPPPSPAPTEQPAPEVPAPATPGETPKPKTPAWAAALFTDADVSTCRKSTFMPDGCESQTLLSHLIGADKIKGSDRFEKSAPMVALKDLQKQLILATADKKPALQKQIDENYTDRTIEIITKDGKRLPFKVANPYLAHEQRSKVVSFGDPAGGATQANLDIINTGIFPKEVLADKAMTVSLLRSMWSCSQGGTATSPDCYPLQVLGELYEYQGFKKQQGAKGRAQKLLQFPEWPVIEVMVSSLRYAMPTVAATGDSSSTGSTTTPTGDGSVTTAGSTTTPVGGVTTPPVPNPLATTTTPTPAPNPPTRPQPLLPTTFGGGMRVTNFLIPNTFGFAPLKPVPAV